MHVVYRFDVGGLENGVVNLINTMPAGAYRHAVLALTEATDFKTRIARADVPVIALHQPPGHGFWMYPALFRLFRALRPAVVHTRNLAALEAVVPAWAAGVPVRIHGEHGRDVGDLRGDNRKYQWVRRLYRPFVHHYVALGSELRDYLLARIGVAPRHVTAICNGVDTGRFHPPAGSTPDPIGGCPFDPARHWIVGSVGRMQAVKDPLNLAKAFVRALERAPELRERLRLVMVGDGPLRADVEALLAAADASDLAWLPGERSDVAALMRGFHAFALPSLAEGISNTILEALATGIPVVATAVGANPELVEDGVTGVVVPAADPGALAAAITALAVDPARTATLGRAARAAAEARFALEAMTASYRTLYDRMLAARGRAVRTAGS
ncbi:TIGR03088 family PEP-CTERM/XrtA system glycosyltransferase [Schlegelella sp. ID0723]|uniref:TIGR03088 family PEP-CTERM/XrtA system glycosyltransferase n=1 Tax=Piscinibacter koreensis TaxID=2742824 RepID=A0A7Y6NL76_9BURK|nr:TIGR03088 family PEP-CTERM/XrtA system glycosyltransferase [Schlegelella koreensis]NUZ05144.1 TIGR03088 family PEP-CTERM/XrtA system glycosyltransferase [Schlegelella koreensis]